MKFFKSMFGFCISAILINTLWGVFTNRFSVMEGWLSAFFITGSLWFINHHLGLIENEKDAA